MPSCHTKLTAEIRLYRWLKRKNTPADAWKQMSLDELAAKAHCSKSQVSRTLPSVVAQLHSISRDAAETLIREVMAVRRGQLIDFEIQIIRQLRSREKPVSYPRLAKMFRVSTKQIAAVCKKFRLSVAECGVGWNYRCSDEELMPEAFHHWMPQIIENAGIRRKLSQKHKDLRQPTRESFTDFFTRLYGN